VAIILNQVGALMANTDERKCRSMQLSNSSREKTSAWMNQED